MNPRGNPRNRSPEDSAAAPLEIVEGIAARRRNLQMFFGHKLAEGVAEEMGLSELTGTDERLLAILKHLMGTAAAAGIILGTRHTTEPADVEAAKAELMEPVPDELVPMVGRLTDVLLSRGMEFHREEWSRETDKAQGWIEEFRAFYPGNLNNRHE